MLTSLPNSRLGNAAGMSTPCSTPLPNPAGPVLLSDDRVNRFNTLPMATATTRIINIRQSTLRIKFGARRVFASVSVIKLADSMFSPRQLAQGEFGEPHQRFLCRHQLNQRKVSRQGLILL